MTFGFVSGYDKKGLKRGRKTISKLFSKLKYRLSFRFLSGIKENFRTNLKGLGKNPFFYVGVILVVLFTFSCCVYSDVPNSVAVSDYSQGNGSAALKGVVGLRQQDLFFDQKETLLPESPDLNIIQDNSLGEVSVPQILSSKVLGAILGTDYFDENRKEVVEYSVESDDTLSSIAQKFGISLNTLLWANDLSKSSKIKVGQKLVILPVSGVVYHVKSGDTISDIANKYKGQIDEIIAFNELSNEGDIYIGDILVIPNGIMPIKPPTFAQIPVSNSYFIFPTEGKITQGIHWYNAVDIANKCETPIYAAAQGTVLKVKLTSSTSRWAYGGAGNHLTILHPNGVVTYYGHILMSFVSPGDEVYQGQKIALIGGGPGTAGAGSSTGCHLHFEVVGAENPLTRYYLGSTIQYK